MAIWNAGLNSDPTVFLESYNKIIIAECILSVTADKKKCDNCVSDTVTVSYECVKF